MDSKDNISKKLDTVLNSFLVPGFSKGSSAEFELLATYLAKSEYNSFLETPVLNWIDRCVDMLIKDYKALHHTVISLMFKLCAIFAENEWVLISLRERNILEKIARIAKDNLQTFTASNKLGHILLLKAISKHNIGLQWIKDSKSWCYIIKYCCQNHTLYVVREASLLIYDILYKSTKQPNKEFCLEMLDEILKPIEKSVYQNSSTIVYVDDSEIQKDLCPTLDLISLIFQKTLESPEKTPIAYLCEVHHKITMNIWKLAKVTHNEFFLGKILKAQTMYNFAMLVFQKLDGDKIDPFDFNEFGVNFFNTMKFCVSRRSCVNFLKLAKINLFLWKKLGARAPLEIFIENETIQFENQLIMFHLMPVLSIVKTQPEEESIFDQYIKKLFSISSEFTVRICYSFRDIILDCPDFGAHLAYKSIHGILSMKTILSKNEAVVLFQALVYVLKEFTICSNENSIDSEPTNPAHRLPQVLYAALTCLYSLVEGFNITWKESIESMCLMDIVLEILKNPNLTTLTVVQSIKLAQLSIEHFLSPNMALLVDNLKGSALQNLGPIVIKNVHNIEWEVRDSTLELVTSIVSISRLKFPAFQQYILENNICSLVFDIVNNDQEYYVRATGLKCLTQMIAVNVLWERELANLNLVKYLLEIICNESEGIVRKEALTCLTQMYVHRRIQAPNIKLLYCTIANIGINDLYWEVKTAALHFWEIAIHVLFTNQGMIDGTFPTVTFSKEAKKIVTLTESEIILRIKKVINELSQIGCLDVILKCLSEDCDLEVVKAAVKVVKALFQKLAKYNYEKALNDDLSTVESEKQCPPDASSDNKPLTEEGDPNSKNMSNKVINDIISTRDTQLLTSCYKQLSVTDETNIKTTTKQFRVTTPAEFVSQLKGIDFDKLVESRCNWYSSAETLSTLLDDIVLVGNIENPLHADCY